MNKKQLREWYKDHWRKHTYVYVPWTEFDYSELKYVLWELPAGRSRKGSGQKKSVNDCFIMIDTETSKIETNKTDLVTGKLIPVRNIVVLWTISIRTMGHNICTLRGRRPSELIKCVEKIHESLQGDRTIFYIHNLPYDHVFIRKFFFERWGHPKNQLNVKPNYPINVEWSNGVQLRDSYILSQRSLEKWAKDMNVEHQKAVGSWDYDKLRTQSTDLSTEELMYAEFDTLAGVECLDKLRASLHKHVYSMPFTATGIPREEVRIRGKMHSAHDKFYNRALTYDQQQIMERVYHGGYTHANRHFIDQKIDDDIIQCYDFASSYPYVMLSEKYPMDKFHELDYPMYIKDILQLKDKYGFVFRFCASGVRIKDNWIGMPSLQFSKMIEISVNPILDNGRVLQAEYVEIWLTEMDLAVIAEQYSIDKHVCVDIMYSVKDYLPRWFTDYVYECFRDKTMLKGGDPVEYAIAKGKVNSLYGMTVQKPIKEQLEEDYITGEYKPKEYENEREREKDFRKRYKRYLNNRNSVLNYQFGVWVTAYAFFNLYQLGACILPDPDHTFESVWLYSDTDSCYAIGWDEEKVQAYNERCKEKLRANGYGPVIHEGKEFWLGVAESEGDKDKYTEFKTMGAKRYCGRSMEDGQLHITVAGVPKKKGALCLEDDIDNFTVGFIFPGTKTGKKTHYYIIEESTGEDENGNEYADSVDLVPCDYLLSSCYDIRWEDLITEEVAVKTYEEE